MIFLYLLGLPEAITISDKTRNGEKTSGSISIVGTAIPPELIIKLCLIIGCNGHQKADGFYPYHDEPAKDAEILPPEI
ncbi:MAG: hypothetical protein WB870_11260 [Gallionellaceae bacterium]